MGMVSAMMLSSRPSFLACLMELMPRSDKARLMDLVKFRGVVEDSRRSGVRDHQLQGHDLILIMLFSGGDWQQSRDISAYIR